MISTGLVLIGTASTTLCTLPPGPCQVVLSNAGTASPVWVGAGTKVTPGVAGTAGTGNGFPVPSGAPVAFACYQGDKGSTLVAACSSGSASIGYFISTSTGQTGL